MTTATDGQWTIRRLLEWTGAFFVRKEIEPARLNAELLLAHVLQIPRIKLYTDYERTLAPRELEQYRGLVKRAGDDEPVAYLTGKAHFFNLELTVTPDVLIPRPDTEVLVENAIRIVRNQPGLESPRLLDLCTGSGCVALAIASQCPTAGLIATDICAKAAAVARANAQRLKLADRVTVLEGDLFDALATLGDRQPFALIVANPPYIATDQIKTLDKSVRDYEPHRALAGGADGLAIHRRILTDAPDWLIPGGHLLLEIAFDQGQSALSLAREFDAFADAKILKDYAGNFRILAVKRPVP